MVEDNTLEPLYSEGSLLYGTPCTIPMRVFEKGDASKTKTQYLIGFSKFGKNRFTLVSKTDNGLYYQPLDKAYHQKFKASPIPINTAIHSCFKVLGTDSTTL